MTGPWARRGPMCAAAVLCVAVLISGCSGIPGSGPVIDVAKVAGQGQLAAPATPEAIVRGFVAAAARVTLSGAAGSAFSAPQEYLTAKAQRSWQAPAAVIILPDVFRVDADSADGTAFTVSGALQGTLDQDKAFHTGNGAIYRLTLHLAKQDGQWRISDPPPELLIRRSDFGAVFSARTLYFLDASHTVVVPDRRYLVNGGTPENRAATLMNLLLRGPAGVLKGAAESELTGGALRTVVATEADGLTTRIDLKGIDAATAADRAALAAQVVWTLNSDVGQVAISLNGLSLDRKTASYTLSTVESFGPDRVPGNGQVASDPYFIDPGGAVIDLLTKDALWGSVGTGSAKVASAAMSAATGTLAAVSNLPGKAGQALLIGQPLNHQPTTPALEAPSLTRPSFSRSGDEVWVVQNGASKNPEIYQVSTGPTSSTITGNGTASRAKVAADLIGKGAVTSLVLSPDGVRVALVAGGRLYLGAIAAPATTGPSATPAPATPDVPSVINLQQLRGELTQVGPVAFSNATELLVGSANGPSPIYHSITDMKVDGYDLPAVTTGGLFGDVQALAVSVAGTTPADGSATATQTAVVDSSAAGSTAAAAPATPTGGVYISFGGAIYKLKDSLTQGEWVSADAIGSGPFFPN